MTIKIPNWTISCGARELQLDKTSTTKEIMNQLAGKWTPGLYFFTETKKTPGDKTTQAELLIAYIEANNLGKIIRSPEIKVRKTTATYLWQVNHAAMEKRKINRFPKYIAP